MANVYFSAEFAGIPILIAEIETSEGRDKVVQSPARGDRHKVFDRGQKHVVATVQLLFIDQPGQAPYLDRFDAIRRLANEDSSQIFSHPLIGSYRATLADFTHRASSDAQSVEANCTIYREDEPQAVFPAGAGVSAAAGLESVTVAGAAADDALAAVGEASDSPTACVDAVSGWSDAGDDDLDTQKVLVEAASLVENLNTEIEALSISLDRWPAYRAMCLLRYQVTRAAESFTSASAQLVDVTVGADMPLLAICTEVYGAALAPDLAPKVAKMNRIRTPGRVTKGTVVKMPSEGAA